MAKEEPLDPVTGPIPRDKFASIVALPFGQAAKEIQKYDPEWGRGAGEKIRWRVDVERESNAGVAYVMAENLEQAEKLAEELTEHDIDWDTRDEFSIEKIEAAKPGET
jgi:hypothetical protein